MMSILSCDPSGFVVWMGVLCSSWSAMSRGSTYRSWLAPLGLPTVRCVDEGNRMVGRRGASSRDLYEVRSQLLGAVCSWPSQLRATATFS